MKKILSLLLILMVVVSSFVACGCNNGENPPSTETGSGEQSQIQTESDTGGALVPDDEIVMPDKKEDFVLPEGVDDNIENDNEIKVN
ncbi:MAG: hypothetical protein IJ400_00250 [Clostridia bacterium]|nr:hypothetical protein [Clostridia bacterium]